MVIEPNHRNWLNCQMVTSIWWNIFQSMMVYDYTHIYTYTASSYSKDTQWLLLYGILMFAELGDDNSTSTSIRWWKSSIYRPCLEKLPFQEPIYSVFQVLWLYTRDIPPSSVALYGTSYLQFRYLKWRLSLDDMNTVDHWVSIGR